MQLITEQIQKSMEGSSWIRKMFEKGLELKMRYGADAVCDFSLGNRMCRRLPSRRTRLRPLPPML